MTLFQGKESCCGCGACVQSCPKGCISFMEDQEGFLYPLIDHKKCIACGLCVSVCPFHELIEAKSPQHAFAAYNTNDKVRSESSSGGFFSLLAKSILDKGGAVFGAMFDERWNVVHGFIESVDEMPRLRGSKYVQSFIGNSYEIAKRFLIAGRHVLFSGTPCQISGLKNYLSKEYDNLVTVDFICHGVPSPELWRWYLDIVKKQISIVGINFRNKDNGWKRYNFAIDYGLDAPSLRSFHKEDPFMMAFLNDLSLRPSCSSCKVKGGRSNSDITIADFWNVDKVLDGFDDDKGTNLVLENSPKGAVLLSSIQDVVSQEVDFAQAIQYNKAWDKSYPMHSNRNRFFMSYHKHDNDFGAFVLKLSQQNDIGFSKRIKRMIKTLLNQLRR